MKKEMPARATRTRPGAVVPALVVLATCAPGRAAPGVDLPEGVRMEWNLGRAFRETTPTRERVCVNGLWRWQPAKSAADEVPSGGWGAFKVPGSWPGITNYMQKDSQRVHAHPSWRGADLRGISMAWYEREIAIPAAWRGRRIALRAEYLNSHAAVFVDGKKAGEVRYPGGEAEITDACRPGGKHTLSLLVTAMPLQGVMLSYSDTASAREVKGSVARRGLCGDVFLVGEPAKERVTDIKIDTSVRKWEIAVDVAAADLEAGRSYRLRARIADKGRVLKELTGKPFGAEDLRNGRIAFSEPWKPPALWDTHTPGNAYEMRVSLLDARGKVLDECHPVSFGFRELWIDGRDFYLNGTRIFLSSVPFDNAQVGAALATYGAAKDSMLRLMSYGINMVYTHNYGCEPGSHLGFGEILRAADDVGLLVSFSQPHFGHYNWDAPDADSANGYARHAEFYVRAAQNHPSVVFYSMSHNGCGYSEDMSPDMMDGVREKRSQWSANNAKRALRAERIVKELDPGRIVYHHASGNLGSMHTSNFYPNFAPVQELSDWFEHWAAEGVKPVFLCEYGAPFTWDWAMYRGWYKGRREFGSARVPWEFCLGEWNAQFIGDAAYRTSEKEKRNLRWERDRFRAGELWCRWDYPHRLGSGDIEERHPILADYVTDNWRAFRTWGVSAISPWEHGVYWRKRPGLDRNRMTELPVDWGDIQRPGLSPDYIQDRYERMDIAYERSDWVVEESGRALVRNNGPLLAYIAGKPAGFTGKDHNFLPGDAVEKQLIVINNSREAVTCDCSWSLPAARPASGSKRASVKAGEQERIPLRFSLPATLAPGAHEIAAKVRFGTGETQEDSFTIHVMQRPPAVKPKARIALFDPKGETGKMLAKMGVRSTPVRADADLSAYDVLVIGKAALAADAPAPDVARVRDGLRILVFEQTAEAMERRLGFRIAEYGLRRAFPRVPDHPALEGISAEHLRDWCGEATTSAPRLAYELSSRLNEVPAVKWCGMEVSRVWRCGNRGNVASVLVEKPARGDFLPIVDGGFGLQYAPLMEYREGKGLVLLCQMDVTGRTEDDPAAERLARNLVEYVAARPPASSGDRRRGLHAGGAPGRAHCEKAGFRLGEYAGGALEAGDVLVVTSGGGEALRARRADVAAWLRRGGRVVAVGLGGDELRAFLPFDISTKRAEHVSCFFEPAGAASPLAGVGPAELHSRDPGDVDLVTGGVSMIGDGVLAVAADGAVAICQVAPWSYGKHELMNVKRTFRRTSVLLARLLGNAGLDGATPLLERLARGSAGDASPWLTGYYMDSPVEFDDPYRFFRW